MTSQDPVRESEIWREFRQAQGHALSRRVRENPPPDAGIFFLTLMSLALVNFTDWVVWWDLRPSEIFFPAPPHPVFLVSLILLPLNGWFAHALLTRWTPQDRQRPVWVRALRFAAACLFPVGGMTFPPVWRDLLRRNPPWIRPRGDRSAHLTLRKSLPKLPKRWAMENLYRSQILWFSLVLAGGLPFLLGGVMIADPQGPLGRPGAIAFNLGFHVITFLGMGHIDHKASHLSKGNPRTRLLHVRRWLLLFPSPICLVSFLLIILDAGPLRVTWIGRLYSVRSDALRFPLWRKAGEAFRPTIRRFWTNFSGRPPQAVTHLEEGRGVGKREALARLKLLFLPAEAGLLTWLLLQVGARQPQPFTLVALFAAASGLALGSLLLQPFPGLAEKLRWDRVKPLAPYLRNGSLLLPTAGCLLGILGGAGAAQGDIRIVGMVLKLLTVFLSLLGVAYLWRGFVRDRLDLDFVLMWGSLYVSLDLLGRLLETSPGLAKRAVILALATPVLSIVAGLALSPSLLRPFTWRHVFDNQFPGGLRATLAGVGLTAVLPLGGLAEPLWIWARCSLLMERKTLDLRRSGSRK